MHNTIRRLKTCNGSVVFDVVAGAAVIIFLILPLFSFAVERYMILVRAQAIKDSVDITNTSLYYALKNKDLSQELVAMEYRDVYEIYTRLLAQNLRLNPDLSPAEGSAADGVVQIISIQIVTGALPWTCPEGVQISRPSIHSKLIVPVKPGLFQQSILRMLGKDAVELVIHIDTEIPVNN